MRALAGALFAAGHGYSAARGGSGVVWTTETTP